MKRLGQSLSVSQVRDELSTKLALRIWEAKNNKSLVKRFTICGLSNSGYPLHMAMQRDSRARIAHRATR